MTQKNLRGCCVAPTGLGVHAVPFVESVAQEEYRIYGCVFASDIKICTAIITVTTEAHIYLCNV